MKKSLILFALAITALTSPLIASEYVEKTLQFRLIVHFEEPEYKQGRFTVAPLNRFTVTSRYIIDQIGYDQEIEFGSEARLMLIEEFKADGPGSMWIVIREPGYEDYDVTSLFPIKHFGTQTGFRMNDVTGLGQVTYMVSRQISLRSGPKLEYAFDISGLLRDRGRLFFLGDVPMALTNWDARMAGEDYLNDAFSGVIEGRVTTRGARVVW